MSDTVSKLYAEIGFKVNQDGLKQAKELLKSLQEQMSALNNATKEAAKQYGVFSKDKTKQEAHEAKQATEATKKAFYERKKLAIDELVELKKQNQEDIKARRDRKEQIAKEKTENEKLIRQERMKSDEERKERLSKARENTELSKKQLIDERKKILSSRELERQERQAKKDKDREERQALKEQEQAQKRQQREADKAAKEQNKRLKDMLKGFRSFAVGLRNTFLALAGIGTGGFVYGMKQSLDRSIPTRDFTMTTGVSLNDLQDVMRRMVNTGSGMTQQNVMSDIQRVSQNLADIALGQGELSPYKLLSVAAQRGDVMGVIKGVEQSVRHLDNAMALNLTRRVGLSDDWLAMWRYREREGGDQRQINREQQNEIIEAEIALRQLKFAFKNLSDFLAAAVSPSITKMANGIRDWLQTISSWVDENPNTIRDLLEDLGRLADVVKLAFGMISSACQWFAEKIGNIIKAPKRLWEQSDIGKYFRGLQEGGMSKIDPKFEDELLHWGEDKVKSFNNDRRMSSKNIINATDNRVQNVTINGVAQEEIAEKAQEAVEKANKKEETMLQQKLYGAADLLVVAPTAVG